MKNRKVRWLSSKGKPCISAVAYDIESAEQRKALLESTGAQKVEIFEVKPGE